MIGLCDVSKRRQYLGRCCHWGMGRGSVCRWSDAERMRERKIGKHWKFWLLRRRRACDGGVDERLIPQQLTTRHGTWGKAGRDGMRRSNVRTSQRAAPRLLARQRQLLMLLDTLGGSAGNLDFQKLLFLYCQEPDSGRPYDFVPYKFGACSFTSYADRRKLIACGFLAEDEHHWQLTEAGRHAIGRTPD